MVYMQIIILILLLLLSGCASSCYTEDYNSKEEYYSYINTKTDNEEVILELINKKTIEGDVKRQHL